MSETLREYCDSRGAAMRVEAGAGVIQGVKILGMESRNGRTYAGEALQGAVGLYEGAKVNVNHPAGDPLGPRDYRDRLGVIRNVQYRDGEGLFGDLHFNPKHGLAEQLSWDAEHAPENVGFSHNVQARTARREGRVLVEEIVRVQSVDLVADPATTRGLFESSEGRRGENAVREGGLGALDEALRGRAELLSEAFWEALARAGSIEEQRRLVEDRRRLGDALRATQRESRPQAIEQTWREEAGTASMDEWVRAVKARR